MVTKKRFFNNCVNWNQRDVFSDGGLVDMIDSGREITRKTFLKHVHLEELKEIEEHLGYSRGIITMASDYAVLYCKGKLHGKPVVWFCHSCIEYVFK